MNGPLMNALRTLANIFLCNMMFCLLSLPLFTAGAALTALYVCMQAIIEDDEEDVIVKQFWNAFRQNFKQATAIWLLCIFVFVFLGIYYLIIISMGGAAGKMYCIPFRVPVSFPVTGKILQHGEEYRQKCVASEYCRTAVDASEYCPGDFCGVFIIFHESVECKHVGIFVGNGRIWDCCVSEQLLLSQSVPGH